MEKQKFKLYVMPTKAYGTCSVRTQKFHTGVTIRGHLLSHLVLYHRWQEQTCMHNIVNLTTPHV